MLDYLVPPALADSIELGALVRVPLQGRRVLGWVVELDRAAVPGRPLRAITKLTGKGPDAALLDLASWAAWRWAGRRLTFLRAASPARAVHSVPVLARPGPRPSRAVADQPGPQLHRQMVDQPAGASASEQPALLAEAFAGGARVLRWPPAADPYPIVAEAVRRGQTLVLAPAQFDATWLAGRVAAAGWPVAQLPDGWAQAAAGATVVGSRAAAWAPLPHLAAVVVLDCHDERYQSERAPTWHAVDVAVERASRAGVPCVLVSAAPPLEALRYGPLVAPSRAVERRGWPLLQLVDCRELDPRAGLYSPALVELVRSGASVAAVLNRTGRAKLLACSRCGAVARCERCDSGVVAPAKAAALRCPRCSLERPEVCLHCGATRLSVLRAGVGRAREELEALAGRPVVEITAASAPADAPQALGPGAIVIGTAAVLHRVRRADAVAFLDFDQALLAARFRAAPQALADLTLAARIVGGRRSGGRLLVQTRAPSHPVLDAVLHAEPGRLNDVEAARREALGYPPFRALALLEGDAAGDVAAALAGRLGIEVLGPQDGRYLVRAPGSAELADALSAVAKPRDGLRVEVDPQNA